ncbi:MAG: cell division protein FtsZ, partial [Gammaproteobacteria bacterium]
LLTVAVVTRPFNMEGGKRASIADIGMSELAKHVDSLITIPNQKLLTVLGPKTTLLDAFKSVNGVLQGAVQGIADLITRPGLINVDFADVRTVMGETGMAMMGSGVGTGEDRARVAAQLAVCSPLLEDVNLSGAHGLLINVTAGMDLRTSEFHVVGDTIKQYASEDATVVVGTVIDPELSGELRVTVVATGLGRPQAAVVQQPAVARAATPSVAATAAAATSPVRGAGFGAAGPRPAFVAGGLRSAALKTAATVATGDYSRFDEPAINRLAAAAGDGLRHDDSAEEILDIPTFLRRQAD